MEDWGKIVKFSIFECESAEMAITLAGMISEYQKTGVARGK